MKEKIDQIKLTNEETCSVLCALEYTIDTYNLYKKDEFTKELKEIRHKIIEQVYPFKESENDD